ncbi:hypothetical protein HMPREF0476_0658 [Kingella kingae ATCC 23330]|uniref:Uncharacterized protein n=1 Tax=Kingella kingae ATCC 23330 TaxID=887327 RepID=F5S625_KINKI|nr:hypothetical protein HMPREF0476_0658 [Kingella kingae ATCC 23330]
MSNCEHKKAACTFIFESAGCFFIYSELNLDWYSVANSLMY